MVEQLVIANAVIPVKLDTSQIRAQFDAMRNSLNGGQGKIVSTSTKNISDNFKKYTENLKTLTSKIDATIQKSTRTILVPAIGMMIAGLNKYLQTTDAGAIKLQMSINTLRYSFYQLLARIGQVITEKYRLVDVIKKLAAALNSISPAKISAFLDAAKWMAIVSVTSLLVKNIVGMVAGMTSLAALLKKISLFKAVSTAGGAGVSATGGGAAVGAASGFGGVISTIVGSLAKVIPFLLKISGIFLIIGTIIASFGEGVTYTERFNSGLGVMWKWLKVVGNAIAIVFNLLEQFSNALLFLFDVLKSLVFGALKASWKILTNDMVGAAEAMIEGIYGVKEAAIKFYQASVMTKDKIAANFEKMFNTAMGNKPEAEKTNKPFTFMPTSIQSVGFTELGKAQQQLALNNKLASDTSETAKNTARTADILSKIASGSGSGLPSQPVYMDAFSGAFKGGSGGTGNSGGGYGSKSGGGW